MTALSHFSPFLPSLLEATGEDEWTSEIGEREPTAECGVVGLLYFNKIVPFGRRTRTRAKAVFGWLS
jgi:hypothetical protein